MMRFLKKLFMAKETPQSEAGSSNKILFSTHIGAPGAHLQPSVTNIVIPTSDRGGDAEERAKAAIVTFSQRHPEKKMDVEVFPTNDGMVFSVELSTQNYKDADELGRELVGLLRHNGFCISKFDYT